jgi:hypothetical protein
MNNLLYDISDEYYFKFYPKEYWLDKNTLFIGKQNEPSNPFINPHVKILNPEIYILKKIQQYKESDYKNILFFWEEYFFNYTIERQIQKWVSQNKKIYFKTFTWGFVDYLKNKFGENNIIGYSKKALFKKSYELMGNPNLSNLNNKKNIILNWTCANRSLIRDYTLQKIILPNKLHENKNNFITFHNLSDIYSNLIKNNYVYRSNEINKFVEKFNLDLKEIDFIKIGSEDERNIIKFQSEQQKKIKEYMQNSMFSIITETCHPYSDDPKNIWYYHTSFSRKTLYPILYKNVFYIPQYSNYIYSTLKELGFEIFFENDTDFVQNLNEDFYYNKETQEKIILNFENMKKIIHC